MITFLSAWVWAAVYSAVVRRCFDVEPTHFINWGGCILVIGGVIYTAKS